MNVPYNGRLLKLGSVGNDVYACKRALKAAGYAKGLQPNKVFGVFTDRNTRLFQKARGLTPDGRIGQQTLAALDDYFDMYGYYLYTGQIPGGGLLLPATFKPTHETAGLPGFPAIDLFSPGGTTARAPEDGYVDYPHFIKWNHGKHVGGWTIYYQGKTDTYFGTHFGSLVDQKTFRKGEPVGTVGTVPHGWWPSHVHWGKHKGRYEPGV